MSKRTLFALLLCAAVLLGQVTPGLAGQAQTSGQRVQATRPPAIPAGFRLLNLKEGRAIAQGIAWADDEEGLAPDCSHLVHTLYEQAGYPYPYASSVDLYRGTGQFLRVRHPQPGDLIVWRGHVGIVVDPREHSFFSSVTSGARIENYRSAYWQARGYPRFYRYLTKSPLKGGAGTSEAADRPPNRQFREQGVLGDAGNRASEQASVRAVKASPVKAHTDVVPATTTRAEDSSQALASQTFPQQILLRTKAKQFSAADVTSALEAANLEAGEALRAGNLERLEHPVVVYRQLQVSGVEVKGKRAVAQIQVETVATLTPERMEPQLGWEDHQLELQRTKKGWMMTPANQNVYVPRDGAMRILAARLAALTQSAERNTEKDREQSDIVRFMNLLIE
ncbi:MAG TPA: NlpC/P60 family protein [Candidatus Acidoferrum sp.]